LDFNVTGDGLVNFDPGESTYANGTIVKLEAVANSGWMFSHWNGDLSSSENPVNISIDDDKSITANFTRIGYTIDINLIGDGIVEKNPDKPTYLFGEVVDLTAIAEKVRYST